MTTDFDSYTLDWDHFKKYPIKDYEPFFSRDKKACPFFVDENFLSPSTCDSIVNKLFLSNRTDSLRYAYVYNSPKDSKHNLNQRRTHVLQMPDDALQLYQRKFRLVEEKISDYFNIKITEHEELQVLGYGIGCKFDMHCDNSTYSINNDQEFFRWKLLLPNRKLTSVVFISDYADPLTERNQYNGGEFEFKYVLDKYGNPVKLTPKKGTIVSFPSHPYFIHVVNEVKKGYRITLTNWYDVEKLD
jgi:SM-20-related protein